MRLLLAFVVMLAGVPAYAVDCFNCVQPVQVQQVQHVQKVQAIQYGHAVQQVVTQPYYYVQVAPQIADYSAGVQSLRADPYYKEFLQTQADYREFLKHKLRMAEAEKLEQRAGSSVLAQKCGQCHGESLDDPKGGYRLLQSGNSWETIGKSLKQIVAETMPPKDKLTKDEKQALMDELLKSSESEQ